ncbi:MAG: hypothetical protein FJX84_04390 [Bacteroidetes bacterium]|nr:hypothetical protein [Bacteroidota bacterium]
MHKIKIIVDGIELSKNEINEKQNFRKVLKEYQKNKPVIFKTVLFYGIIGLSSLLFFVLF